MAKAHSGDLRVRVYDETAGGGSRRAAARRFGVSASTGIRRARRMAERGSLAPGRQGRPPGQGKLAAHQDILVRWVDSQGDITMPELAARLAAERDVVVHPASVSRFLRTLGYTFKKNAAGQRSRTPGRSRGTPNVA